MRFITAELNILISEVLESLNPSIIPSGMYEIEIADHQQCLTVDEAFVRNVVQQTLEAERIVAATISVAIVDNARIHELNRQYLNHDYETDVLSFLLEESIDSSIATTVHGLLHLCGYDDLTAEELPLMRTRECEIFEMLGLPKPTRDASDRGHVDEDSLASQTSVIEQGGRS